MNKLFSFANIAGIIFPVIMVLQIILSVFRMHNPYFNVAIYLVINGLWIAFFTLLIQASVKRSPIVPPSWIAIGAFAISLIAGCISSYGSILIVNKSDNWETIASLFSVSNVLHYIYAIAAAVAFFWLSKYFPKGSVLKAMCIVIAVVAVLIQISHLTIHPWKIENESTRNTVQIGLSVFWALCSFIPPTIFFIAFSKLKK